MVFLARERRMSGRKQLQSLLPPAFLVLAWQIARTASRRDGSTISTGIEHSAIAASIAPTARPYLKPDDAPCFGIACARSIKARIGCVPIDEVADGDDVDALFGAGADDRNVDRLDQPRGCAVLDGDDGQPAANTGIDA